MAGREKKFPETSQIQKISENRLNTATICCAYDCFYPFCDASRFNECELKTKFPIVFFVDSLEAQRCQLGRAETERSSGDYNVRLNNGVARLKAIIANNKR
jgi:hypothetical protein